MSLYTHWVCFDCRKSFHYLPQDKNTPTGKQKCPECKEAMSDIGIYFEAPLRRAKKAWAVMELLSRSGYSFQTEGSKAFIDSFILTTKRPAIEGVRQRIAQMKQEDEESRIKTRIKRYKDERKGRPRN